MGVSGLLHGPAGVPQWKEPRLDSGEKKIALNPDHPACSLSLYQLSYPSLFLITVMIQVRVCQMQITSVYN
jgi:hypothetical protein